MSIRFYYHAQVEDISERRALLEVARSLLRAHGKSGSHHFVLVANILPDREPTWRHYPLTQLDALLLAKNFVTILDFKSVAGPVDATNLEGKWYQLVRGRRELLKAGSARNPYEQISRARNRWMQFFRAETRQLDLADPTQALSLRWEHLSGRILFYPSLHRDSTFGDPSRHSVPKWLGFLGVQDVIADTFNNSSALRLTPALMTALAEQVLKARPWEELTRIIHDQVGRLEITRADGTILEYPLYRYTELTIGRSSANDIPIDDQFTRTSGIHAKICSTPEGVVIMDLGSSHGTFVDGKRVPREHGVRLKTGVRIELGSGETEEGKKRVGTVLFLAPRQKDEFSTALTEQE